MERVGAHRSSWGGKLQVLSRTSTYWALPSILCHHRPEWSWYTLFRSLVLSTFPDLSPSFLMAWTTIVLITQENLIWWTPSVLSLELHPTIFAESNLKIWFIATRVVLRTRWTAMFLWYMFPKRARKSCLSVLFAQETDQVHTVLMGEIYRLMNISSLCMRSISSQNSRIFWSFKALLNRLPLKAPRK